MAVTLPSPQLDAHLPNAPLSSSPPDPPAGFVLAWRSRYRRRPSMPSRARALLFCLLAACGRDAGRLPAEIRLEQVVADLSATFDPSAAVEQAVGAPVHLGGIQPTGH